MTLVLKTLTQQAPEGAEELRYHALANDGTLLLYDFSNAGCVSSSTLTNGDKVQDLGRQTSLPLGINNEGLVKNFPEGVSTLTEGKGFTTDVEGVSGSGVGLGMGTEIMSYLAANKPNSVAIITYRVPTGTVVGGNVFIAHDSLGRITEQRNIEVVLSEYGRLRFRFGNTSITTTDGISPQGQLTQFAIEFRGDGLPGRMFWNGQFVKETPELNPDGFVEPTYPTIETIGLLRTGPSASIAVYMFSITDLTKTDKTADEVVKETWDYANSQGKFAGMKKMPYVDTY